MENFYNFKIIILGDSSVGKTSLARKYILDESPCPIGTLTIGVEFFCKNIQFDNNNIKLSIWDTAGQERFRSVTSSYYRGSIGVILCFSSYKKKTFQNLKYYIEEIFSKCVNPVIVLVENFIDMSDVKEVSESEINQFLEEINNKFHPILPIKYFKASSVSGENVENVFDFLVKSILDNIKSGHILLEKWPNSERSINVKNNVEQNMVKNNYFGCCR